MSINRRTVLTASLASAAAVGLSANVDASAEADSQTERSHTDSSPVLVNLYDYEAAAKRILSGPAWEYFNGGSADEITLRRNRQALDLLQLKPKVLVDVSRIDMKGLAYGASAVLIGRPYIYGLSVSGADGVRSVIDILRTELEGAMAMTGRTRLNEIDRSVLWKSHDYRE
jgi:isopentenyl diphosphate isomerase/L-lactate dehydrogenase-like FMN-dependent dehydrogenase